MNEKNQTNRTRNIELRFRVNEHELFLIEDIMKNTGYKNKSDYLRRCATLNAVYHTMLDTFPDKAERQKKHDEAKELNRQIAAIGRNINQIAERINATGHVYENDISEAKEQVDKVWQLLRYTR